MWEHKVVEPGSYDIVDIQEVLDKASKEGWELVSVSDGYKMYLFFKRPKK